MCLASLLSVSLAGGPGGLFPPEVNGTQINGSGQCREKSHRKEQLNKFHSTNTKPGAVMTSKVSIGKCLHAFQDGISILRACVYVNSGKGLVENTPRLYTLGRSRTGGELKKSFLQIILTKVFMCCLHN